MQLTSEQEAVLSTDHDLVINAVAGSGKTTTLIEYAKSRLSNSRILYLAFNKTVKSEAIQKFEGAGVNNVRVETAHSLAFDYIIRHSNYNVIQGYKSYEWCDILNIDTGDRHSDFIVASHVNKFISYFCNSNSAKVQELKYTDVISDAKAKTFALNFYTQIEHFTREALAKMDRAEISVTHDFYLKKFQLSNPALPYDYILFDEGQDASAAMLDVFLKQKATKIIVGDVHQQIYGWRYAINSLQQVDFPVFNLSNSFRFDEEIALIANKILEWKKHLKQTSENDKPVKITGTGHVNGIIKTKATIGRTNLSLLINAISQWQQGNLKRLHFEGNINSYTFADEGASLYDVLNLYNGKPQKIKDKLIAGMKTMRELEDYIEKTEDNSLGMIVEVVKEFGNKLPFLINELKSNHTALKEDAEMIFSTVHRCKGMEYDEVTLLNDFVNEEKLKQYILQNGGDKITQQAKDKLSEEINILYVAATRAKSKLKIPSDLNPLKSIDVVNIHPAQISNKKNYRSDYDDGDIYGSSFYGRGGKSAFIGSSNHGKRWTDEEEEEAAELFTEGVPIKEIAKKLGRGVNGVTIKLENMGLMEEE